MQRPGPPPPDRRSGRRPSCCTTVRSDGSVYVQIAAGLTGPVKAAPGFRSHAAYPAGGGLVVTEVWDSAEDHRAFVNSAVKPSMPDGVPVTIEVTELRNAFTA